MGLWSFLFGSSEKPEPVHSSPVTHIPSTFSRDSSDGGNTDHWSGPASGYSSDSGGGGYGTASDSGDGGYGTASDGGDGGYGTGSDGGGNGW